MQPVADHRPAPSRLFLGIEQSAMGRAWRDRLTPEASARALAMVQQQGLDDLLARLLAGRGVGPDEALAFLDPSLRGLMPDPGVLQGMQPAVDRLLQAIKKQEKVAIFGDYDVDGACSAALLAEFLNNVGCPCQIHIPDRIFEGYGPNEQAIAMLREQGASLLVCVDCGTTSHEVLAKARGFGLDVLVIDHHQAPEVLPDAIIVNPNRLDDVSGLGALCAAGVVFMVLVALVRALREQGFWTPEHPAPDLLNGLDLVALATIADVAPLTGLNRAFVSRGLMVMKGRGRIGLRALMDKAGLDGPPRPFHLGFLLGPRINAGGRIGDAALGARLLLVQDETEANQIAAELDRLNRERQTIEAATLELAEAEALASLGLEEKGAVVVTASDGWHPGIVGLVAARLKEKFRRPAFAIAFAGMKGTGSGRSIAGVDLGRAVRLAVEAGLLVKGGGHAMAAGITLERAQLGAFRAYIEEKLAPMVEKARADEALLVDAALSASGATPALIAMIEQAGPFGAGNPEPVFVFPAHRITDAAKVGENHVRVRARSGDGGRLEAIAFRALTTPMGKMLLESRGEALHLAGHLTLDKWGGRERVQLRLTDAARPL